jgi:Rrf2 family protein
MKITALEEYGLRCMMQLALTQGDRPMTVAQVAENEGMSTEYAGKLLNLLGQAELVQSVRGRNGGFVLAKTAGEISVAAIVRALSTDLFDSEFCERHTGAGETCVHQTSCALRPVWSTVSEIINHTLERITLRDLVGSEQQVTLDLQSRSADGPPPRIGADRGSRIFQLTLGSTDAG